MFADMDEQGIKNTNVMEKGDILDETKVILSLPAQVISSSVTFLASERLLNFQFL